MTNHNWATNIDFHDAKTLHPQSIEELASIVSSSPNVRVRGTAHCFNTIADTNHTAVVLDAMPKQLTINVVSKTATVSAGLIYSEISELLEAQGWAIHNLASLPHITIGGATATGTHGSGIKNGALHTSIRSVELMRPDGTLHKLTRGVDEEFYAVIVGLGLTGIAVSFELDIEPTFQIMQTIYGELPLKVFGENIIEILSGAYSVSFFSTWDDDQVCEIWYKSKTTPPATYFGASARTEKAHPIFGEDATAATEQFGQPGPWHLRLPHFKIGQTPSAGKELQSEFFVDSKNAAAAFAAFHAISKDFRHKVLVTEIRSVAADDYWMSPAYGRESVAFHCTWMLDDEVPHLVSLIEAVLQPFSFRPHVGKVFNVGSYHLRKVLPKFDEFREYVMKTDPGGKFQNDFTRALLDL